LDKLENRRKGEGERKEGRKEGRKEEEKTTNRGKK
tara:strand:+ start:497 stop:601 length:105 start_codon:yes stop_codon:yes gene_type:complete